MDKKVQKSIESKKIQIIQLIRELKQLEIDNADIQPTQTEVAIKTTASRKIKVKALQIYSTYDELFMDEDTGEVVSIPRVQAKYVIGDTFILL